jgi:hypothetical protein
MLFWAGTIAAVSRNIERNLGLASERATRAPVMRKVRTARDGRTGVQDRRARAGVGDTDDRKARPRACRMLFGVQIWV